jgi:hypothetical protein
VGTLYQELQKWIKSPLEKQTRYKGQIPSPSTVKEHLKSHKKLQSKGVVVGPKVVKTNQNKNDGKDTFSYLVGQYAIDVATLAGLSVQSLAYRTGESPQLLPWALRFSPEQAYIDLGRLSAWDRWRVLWTRVGAHYFQDKNQ